MKKQEFEKSFDKQWEDKNPEKTLNVAIVGTVSAGKSSLINAIFECPQREPIAAVNAKSGQTTDVKGYELDKYCVVYDSPGLNDIRKENSKKTEEFLQNIDVGVYVIASSSDVQQKENYQDLKDTCHKVFLVLNKIDQWDDEEPEALREVIEQWKSDLGHEGEIYPVCTKGYSEKAKEGVMDIRGVDELRSDLMDYLEIEGKSVLLARHLRQKDIYANRIIASALAAVAVEAFIPGSAAYITATQVGAISSLNYLYTGEFMSKSSALVLIPTFAAESIGTSLFLFAKSFLPPTGVVDVAAALVAVSITFAMLGAIRLLFEAGYDLDDKDVLKNIFRKIRSADIHWPTMDEIRSGSYLRNFVAKILSDIRF